MRTITGVRLICDSAKARGISVSDCLEGTGITEQDLQQDDLKLSSQQEITVIENYVALAKDSIGLGAEIGSQMHVNVFGIWGFAILTSPTMRTAFSTAIDYVQLSFVLAKLVFKETDEGGELVFDMSELPSAIEPFVLERHAMVTLNFFKEGVSQSVLSDLYLKTTISEPGHLKQLSDVLGIKVKGSMDCHSLVIPQYLLDLPRPKSDPVTLKFCLEQCDAMLSQELATEAQPNEEKLIEEKPWTERVKEVVLDDITIEKTLNMVASQLSVTERTLRRRLSEEGTTYRELYADIRLTIAKQLLEASCLNVDTVSWRVGYAEPASFVRAFSKKFGCSPGSIKKHC
ncbi:AraC family transcriptional regulator [Photobacterium sanctipauli]|uniref:AraC family transcriptional regulator n=1 Tax=Photobacterium sanctipauli TaxID=1342794 RepID=A0A2T3NPK3_9GAMM|nr:AraC family transcriptional regulator [Photobacterium sanctipauli]PSW18199.1 AraC family transcriptional regulator [Photobacterium sanctipauli]